MAESEVLSKYQSIRIVPAAAGVAGEVLLSGDTYGFLLVDITAAQVAAGEKRTLIIKAEQVRAAKTAPEVWVAGELVYFDTVTNLYTNVSGVNTVLVGVIHEAALSAATEGFINFDGVLENLV